jgi:hypothetical protein
MRTHHFSASLHIPALAAALLAGCLGSLAGCQSTMMMMKEQVGIPKRDQLVARVEDVQEAQQDAKQEFQSALDQFLALNSAAGGKATPLETTYKRLQSEYDDAKDAVDTVKKRIANTQTVSTALFKEWQAEIGTFTNPGLKQQSQEQYTTTKAEYDQLISLMQSSASKMDPVLNTFREQVLFLKHNLNAQAIGSLMNRERGAIESQVTTLIADMQRSIDEADAFIKQMKK